MNKEFISSHESIYNSMYLVFYYLILNIVFNYGRAIWVFFYLRKNNLGLDHTDNFTIGIKRLSFFLNHLIFVLIVIDVLIIEVRLLLTTLSIVAVALVLIFKDYISNFLYGLNLMFTKDFRIKDTVKFGDTKGKIIDFTFHNVQLRNETGDIIYIPNSTFLSKEITNLSKSSLKNISIEATIPKKDLKSFKDKKDKINKTILGKYSENIQSIENISSYLSKADKETVTINFELYLPKYSYSVEKGIRSFIIEEIAMLAPEETDKKQKRKRQNNSSTL